MAESSRDQRRTGLFGFVLGTSLFAFYPPFKMAVVEAASELLTFAFTLGIMLFGLSLLWKGAMSNFKGDKSEKKK